MNAGDHIIFGHSEPYTTVYVVPITKQEAEDLFARDPLAFVWEFGGRHYIPDENRQEDIQMNLSAFDPKTVGSAIGLYAADAGLDDFAGARQTFNALPTDEQRKYLDRAAELAVETDNLRESELYKTRIERRLGDASHQ